ncbi:MAG TPA: nickel-binding protein [Gaiella sp.]|nr:nickel-binding protein [Gaiella sp.]
MGGAANEAQPGVRAFLVEHYWPGVTPAEFGDAARRVRASAQRLARDGKRVRYLHSTLVPVDESAFCVLEAESERLVEEAYERAGVRFERLVAAVETASERP